MKTKEFISKIVWKNDFLHDINDEIKAEGLILLAHGEEIEAINIIETLYFFQLIIDLDKTYIENIVPSRARFKKLIENFKEEEGTRMLQKYETLAKTQ